MRTEVRGSFSDIAGRGLRRRRLGLWLWDRQHVLETQVLQQRPTTQPVARDGHHHVPAEKTQTAARLATCEPSRC